MTLAEEIKLAEEAARKDGLVEGGGNFYKFKEGDNRFRVLTKPTMIFKAGKEMGYALCFTGCGYTGRPRFMCYVLDRNDDRVKLAEFPATVGTTIAGYEVDDDYAFSGYPMPYDIKVNAKGAGTKEVEYTVTPGRANTEVSGEIMVELAKKTPVEAVIEQDKDKARKMHGLPEIQTAVVEDDGLGSYEDRRNVDINPSDIPF